MSKRTLYLFCMTAIGLDQICGQSLDTFQALAQGPAHPAVPTAEQTSAISKSVAAATPDAVRGALPLMVAAFQSGDEAKRAYGFLGLFATAMRPDGLPLLKDIVVNLEALLASPDVIVQRSDFVVLSTLQDGQLAPIPGLREATTAFVKRTDRELGVQADAVRFLLHRWEGEPSAQDVVESFWSRDLDVNSRVLVLWGIARGNANPKPARLISLVTSALDNADANVRSVAIDSLVLMGPLAVMDAEPSLRKLIQDTGQPDSIKSAAKKALKDAGLSVK